MKWLRRSAVACDLLLGDLLASLAMLDLGLGIDGAKVQYDGAVIAYGGGNWVCTVPLSL